MSGTISLSGITSSTDWTKIIDATMDARKAATETPLNASKTKLQSKLTAWQSFNSMLSTITNYIDVNTLTEDDGYKIYSTSLSSDYSDITPSDILSASTGADAAAGNHTVEVTTLARAEKISSDETAPFASTTEDLGLSGNIIINGKTVVITPDYSLFQIVAKINAANAGTTASIVSPSASEHYLIIESDDTGSQGLGIYDGSDSDLLEALKLHTGANETIAHLSGNDALSATFTKKDTSIKGLLGSSLSTTGTITIEGTDHVSKTVDIDFAADSLDAIAQKINGQAIVGVTASVEQVEVNGATKYQLKLSNINSISLVTDDKNMMETLGFIKGEREHVMVTPEDAALKVDGFNVASSSNTLTSVLGGITLTLKGTNASQPVNLAVTMDNTQLTTKVTTLVQSLNSVLTFIKSQNTYARMGTSGTSTNAAPALIGDINLSVAKDAILKALFADVEDNAIYKNLINIGVSFSKDGTVTIDPSKLTTSLTTNRGETINVLKQFSNNLNDSLGMYIDPNTGTLVSIKNGIQDDIDAIDERISDFEDRLARERESMEKKFNALEVLITTNDLTKQWLTQQVDLMSKSK
jgi:flagellar hook-associated protein 2